MDEASWLGEDVGGDCRLLVRLVTMGTGGKDSGEGALLVETPFVTLEPTNLFEGVLERNGDGEPSFWWRQRSCPEPLPSPPPHDSPSQWSCSSRGSTALEDTRFSTDLLRSEGGKGRDWLVIQIYTSWIQRSTFRMKMQLGRWRRGIE